MTPYADELDEDIDRLAKRVDAASYQPAQVANGAVELLNEVSKSKITGEEERYSHTDLIDFQANVDGAKEAFVLLRPVLSERDASPARTVGARFAAVDAAFAPSLPARRDLRRLRHRHTRSAPRAQPGRGRPGRAALEGRRDDRLR